MVHGRPQVTGASDGAARPSAERAVLALTGEIPNYSGRLASSLGCPPSDLWALVLAVSGRMIYAEVSASPAGHAVRLGVPDTQFELWKLALEQVVGILGDPEARYRTGYDSAPLLEALAEFFVDADLK